MKQIVMKKVKRGGGWGQWPAYRIATDEHGHWLYSPKGTVYHGHLRSGEVIPWEVGRPPNASVGGAELHLVPPSGWWVAKWYVFGGVRRISVDVCAPAVFDLDECTFVDLELDPFWGEDGSLGVQDEEELEQAIALGQIDLAEASRARAASVDILGWLRAGIEPFGATGWRRFEEALRSQLPPILVA